MPKSFILRVLVLLASISGALGAQPAAAQPTAGPAPGAPASLERIYEEYFEEYLEINPIFASLIGDERYTNRLTMDIDPNVLARYREMVDRYLERTSGIDPEKLDEHERVHFEAFRYLLATTRDGFEFPDHLMPIAPGTGIPSQLIQMASGDGVHPFRTVKDYEDFIARLWQFPAWVGLAIANMNEGMERGIVEPGILIHLALQEIGPYTQDRKKSWEVFYRPIKQAPRTISAEDRRRLEAEFRSAIEQQVKPAFRRLFAYLRDRYRPRSTISLSQLPDGERWYRHRVRFFTTTDLEPDEIYALGLREVERVEGELEQLRRRLEFRGNASSFRDIMARDRKNYIHGDRAVVNLYDRIRKDVTAALPKLFNRVPATPFEIRRVDPSRESSSPGAFYQPGSADGSRPGIFFFRLWDGYHPTYSMETLFLHEGLPGHHFQTAMAQELDVPRFLRFGYFGAYVEGWGLYAETLGHDLGLYTEPRQLFGHLDFDLGRASRLVGDVGIHHKKWSHAEALRELQARHLDWAANEMDRRYVAIPAQALSYKIGELEILRLRQAAEAKLGDRFDIRRFHEVLLEDGPLPLTVLAGKVERWLARGGR